MPGEISRDLALTIVRVLTFVIDHWLPDVSARLSLSEVRGSL